MLLENLDTANKARIDKVLVLFKMFRVRGHRTDDHLRTGLNLKHNARIFPMLAPPSKHLGPLAISAQQMASEKFATVERVEVPSFGGTNRRSRSTKIASPFSDSERPKTREVLRGYLHLASSSRATP